MLRKKLGWVAFVSLVAGIQLVSADDTYAFKYGALVAGWSGGCPKPMPIIIPAVLPQNCKAVAAAAVSNKLQDDTFETAKGVCRKKGGNDLCDSPKTVTKPKCVAVVVAHDWLAWGVGNTEKAAKYHAWEDRLGLEVRGPPSEYRDPEFSFCPGDWKAGPNGKPIRK